FVADAATGHPIPEAKLEFFGYKQEFIQPNVNKWRTDTTAFVDNTDKDGQFFVGANRMFPGFSWLVTARQKKDDGERLAYLGFTGIWFGRQHDPQYHATRVFTLTDRPVYRPEQNVHLKAWIRHAKYDEPDASDFATQTFNVLVTNPKGDKVLEK